MKLRHIDLSRIHEGIVTSDERYGYMPVAGKLADIELMTESGALVVPALTYADINTGKVSMDGEPNWEKEDDDD
jgi:hypothetical protein